MSAIVLEKSEGVATCRLNRPEALNGIDEEVLEGLARALADVAADRSIKALVITGAGDAFCVGLDIELLGRAFADHTYFRDVLERFNALLLAFEALPVPVIAAVNGLARAGGFELILASDLVLIADDARVGDTHLAYGIVPGGGATVRAPRKLGDQRARELLFTGRWLSAKEAVDTGLALRAVPRSALPGAIAQLTGQLHALSRSALAATKAAMNEGAAMPLARALDVELEHFMRHLEQDPNADEGYRAFVEKRKPQWP